jgi:hypothetical protein
VPLKSTGYYNTRTWPEEVKEDPMVMARAQRTAVSDGESAEEKWRKQVFFFFLFLCTLLFFQWLYEMTQKVTKNGQQTKEQ